MACRSIQHYQQTGNCVQGKSTNLLEPKQLWYSRDTLLQAFQGCQVEGTSFNLSQESLTSREVLQLLRKIEKDDPKLYADIQGSNVENSAFLGPIEDEFHNRDDDLNNFSDSSHFESS